VFDGCVLCARSLLEGKTGVSQITRFDASEFPTTFAAQIKDFDNEGCAAHPVGLAGAAVRRRCAAAAGFLRSALMVTACTSLA